MSRRHACVVAAALVLTPPPMVASAQAAAATTQHDAIGQPRVQRTVQLRSLLNRAAVQVRDEGVRP